MSDLNQFKDPKLKLIKSRLYTTKGVNDSPTSITLESTTRFIRIKHVDGGNQRQYTLTLDGNTPNSANTSAFQIDAPAVTPGSDGNDERLYLFENWVTGGETFIFVNSNNDKTWTDEGAGTVKFLLEQYSY